MATFTTEKSKIPSDAVILTKDQAIAYQLKLVQEWEPASDVWPLRYGFSILSGLCGVSAFLINNHIRKKLRLGRFGRFSSYLPTIVIPTATSALLHTEAVTLDILTQEACPVCLEVRAAVIQIGLSTVFPLVTAPLAAFNFALRYNTYRLPSIVEQPREVLKLYKRFLKPVRSLLYYNFIFQIIAAMGITYLEGNAYQNMHLKLYELEEREERLKELE